MLSRFTNKHESLFTRLKQYKIARQYSEDALKKLFEIYLEYHDKGGILEAWQFAEIPITHDAGDLSAEPGTWTKYIRKRLAEQLPLGSDKGLE